MAYVYHPLRYAWCGYLRYVRRAPRRATVVFVGMNPGPFGMAQTGVPFGDVQMVRDWLGIECRVEAPTGLHPKRPVHGFDCSRREISGSRLWGLFRDRFTHADAFFAEHFVVNYCPLLFLEASGRNRTPDKLAANERDALLVRCDDHLRTVLAELQPDWVVGVGAFAFRAATRVVDGQTRTIQILHPSPASPAANRGWAPLVSATLEQAGIWPPRGAGTS